MSKKVLILPYFPFFVSTKFHFDETISLAGLMSFVRRRRSFVPHLWKLCDGITSVILELHFWDLVHCLLISFCFGSEILKKIGPPQPPKKTKKLPNKFVRTKMRLKLGTKINLSEICQICQIDLSDLSDFVFQ